jgi:hypothetical protein
VPSSRSGSRPSPGGWIAWLVAPSVDLSVIGLLTGMRFLSLHGYTDAQLARLQRMLRFCGLLTLTTTTAGGLNQTQDRDQQDLPGIETPGFHAGQSGSDTDGRLVPLKAPTGTSTF